jgi:cytochrome c oxidase subunit 2
LRARLAPLIAVVFAVAGCGSKQNALDAHSKAAKGIESLWWNMLIGCSLAFAVVAIILVAAWFRRSRAGVPRVRDGDKAAFSVVLALGIVVPILTIAALFFFANIFLIRDTTVPSADAAASQKPQLVVRVVAHQFWWEVRYPGTNAVTANEIHIPVRTPVLVRLHTADVIHSFWVPQLNKKQDTLPDQTTELLLYADEPGRYRGQCAEFCGLQHARMGMFVFAEPRARFRAWLANEARPTSPGDSTLFVSKCGSCHTIRGTRARSRVGPDLTHVASRTSLAAATIPNTRARLREWLRDPQQVKPGNEMPQVPLTNAQLSQLVVYLEARR